jgi:hypothetical protein
MDAARTIYRAGIAVRDITPPVGIKLCGFAARTEPSEGVYHPLRATAVAIDDGATPLVLIGADILGFYDRCAPVRSAVADALGLPEGNIILAGSHTHCGPHIRQFDLERLGPLDQQYLQRLTDRIVSAAREAWHKRRDAHLACGVGTCGFAVSRRRRRPDGTVEWGPDPTGPHDHDVPVLTLCDAETGTPFGLVYSYACHPTSRAGLLIGGDYVSFAHDRIEENLPGVTACFVQGCGADQKPVPVDPADTRFTPREIPEVEAIGNELGEAATVVAASGQATPLTGPIRLRRRIIQIESIAPDIDDAKTVLNGPDKRLHPWAERIIHAVENNIELDRYTPFEIQTATFGRSLAIVTLAGEITVEHGLRLKRDLHPHFDTVLVIGYANHIVGYVPVQRQIPEGGYCVEWANKFHGRTGRWVDETEKHIHSTVQQMVATDVADR